jgi:hypothetical protein
MGLRFVLLFTAQRLFCDPSDRAFNTHFRVTCSGVELLERKLQVSSKLDEIVGGRESESALMENEGRHPSSVFWPSPLRKTATI